MGEVEAREASAEWERACELERLRILPCEGAQLQLGRAGQEFVHGAAVQPRDHLLVGAVGEVLGLQLLVKLLRSEGRGPHPGARLLAVEDLEARVPAVSRGALDQDGDSTLEGGPTTVGVRPEPVPLPRGDRRARHERHRGERVGVEEVHAPQRATEGALLGGIASLAPTLVLAQAAPVEKDGSFVRESVKARALQSIAQRLQRGGLRVWVLRRFPCVRDHEERQLALRPSG